MGRERGAEVKTRVPESRRLWGAQPVIVRQGAFVGQTDRWHSKPGRKKGEKKKKTQAPGRSGLGSRRHHHHKARGEIATGAR